MLGSHGMLTLDDDKILHLPYYSGGASFKDPFTFIVPIDKAKLEAGKTYGFRLNGRVFQSKRYYPMKKDFIYTFKIPMP